MKNKSSSFIWGIIFIIAGIGFVGNAFNIWNFTLFFDGWWTLFIIIPTLVSIFQNGPRPVSICGFIIGVLLFLSSQGWFNGSIIEKLIVPIIFIAIGVSMIRRNTGSHSRRYIPDGAGSGTYRRDYTGIFSGQNVLFNENEVFEGCTMNAVFGSVTLDLRDCIINQDVAIECSAIFGGIDIYIPMDVNIKISSTPIFGGVGNKLRNRPYVQGAPTIYVNALCMFGGVDIK